MYDVVFFSYMRAADYVAVFRFSCVGGYALKLTGFEWIFLVSQ